jgi:hypothetical protein
VFAYLVNSQGKGSKSNLQGDEKLSDKFFFSPKIASCQRLSSLYPHSGLLDDYCFLLWPSEGICLRRGPKQPEELRLDMFEPNKYLRC